MTIIADSGNALAIEGDVIRLSVTVTDKSTGQPIDPTELVVAYRVRSRPPVKYVWGVDNQITRDDVGVFHVDVDSTDQAGQWAAEAITAGIGQGSADTAFKVQELPIPLELNGR